MKKLLTMIETYGLFSGACILCLAIIIATYAISFGINSLILYAVCWVFGWDFSLKISFGIWLILCILKSVFSSRNTPS